MQLLAEYYSEIFIFDDTLLVNSLLDQTGGPLLDLGCATGRILEVALTRGLKAIGVDHSSDMIKAGQLRLNKKFLGNVEFHQGEFPDFIPDEPLGLITCVYNTLSMILSKEDRIKTLSNAKRALKKEGRILISLKNGVGEATQPIEKKIPTPQGFLLYSLTWKENLDSMIRTYYMTITLNDRKENHVFPTKILPNKELLSEINDAGLTVESLYGDFQKNPFSELSADQIYVLK